MIGTLLAATLATAAPGTDARDAYARRQFLLDADERCHLLSDREHAALSGSARQARGVLLRAGVRPDPIRDAMIEKASATPCTDSQLREEAATARAAFTRWAALQRQDFPGQNQTWRTSRNGVEGAMAWTLWQDLGDGVRLGLAEDGEGSELILALPAPKGAQPPRTVLMEFRDPEKWRDFVEPTLGGLFPARGGDGLADRVTPDALSKRLWTAGHVEREVQFPDPDGSFLYWSLPLDSLQELAALDPRDVARLTVEYSDSRAKLYYLEIGDLSAALAFLAAGDTPSSRNRK